MADAFEMQMLTFASTDCAAQRAAIRWLYTFGGYLPAEIAESCFLPLAVVQHAINNIP